MRAKPRTKSSRNRDVVDLESEDTQTLNDIERDMRKRQFISLRDLRLRELNADAEKRTLILEQDVKKLKGETTQGGSMGNIATALISMLIAQGMEPAAVNEYIKALDNEAIMRLTMIGSQNMNALLPITLMMAGNKPGGTVRDAVETTKAILDVAKPSGGESSMVTKLVTETIPNLQVQLSAAKDAAYIAQIQQLRSEMEQMKPKSPAEYVKEVAEAAAQLGMRSGSDVSLEIKKLEFDNAREIRKIAADKENTEQIMGTVKTLIEGRVGDLLERVGDAGAERIRGGKGEQLPTPSHQPDSSQVMVQCSNCGGTFLVKSGVKTVKCPHCDLSLRIEVKQPDKQHETEQSRVPQIGGGGGDLQPLWSSPPERNQ